ncbi:MAG: Nudix family hydrolase [Nitrosomonas sp.]|nr:Nudix family hydrolase [Nitrosomonas sp.]
MNITPIVEVAAGVIIRPDGSFLLTCRPEGKPYEGYWEFPGGKIEDYEAPLHALDRELYEELGIQIIKSDPWITRVFTYSHATVRLHFYRITEWHGEPFGRENQQLSWQLPDAVSVSPLLPANTPILNALMLPPVYAITQASQIGIETSLQQIRQALTHGLRLIQIREKSMQAGFVQDFTEQVTALAHDCKAQVLINSDMTFEQPIRYDGIHLTSAELMSRSTRPQSELGLCGASCHNAEELYHAESLALDFVVLGPVLPTLSHADIAPFGWRKFAALIQNYSLPVYALGGMSLEDRATAWEMGAHGIAIMRGITEFQ